MPQTPKPKEPEGHYDEFTEENIEEGPSYCLADQQQLKVGDKIYVDPSIGSDNGDWVTVVSFWHSECWDAAKEKENDEAGTG